MKNNLKYIIVALAGLSLFACNTKEDSLPQVEEPSVDGYAYTVAVAGDTKASIDVDHVAWAEGDKIGWFTDKAGSSEINMEAEPRTFEVSSNSALEAGSLIYAYAPYKEGEQTKTSAPLCIPASQDAVMTDAMPMVSLPVEVSGDLTAGTAVGEARFVNLGAVIRYNVYTTNAEYAAEKVQSVTFAADGNIAGDFTVDLTAVGADAIPAVSGLDQNTVKSTLAEPALVGTSKADGIEVYQVVAPGTWSGAVVVTTDVATYEYTIDGKEFERAVIKPLNVDLASENAVRTSSVEQLLTSTWWELKTVREEGKSVTTSVGNRMKLNKDFSIEFDCSANGGQTFCHTWNGCLINPGDNGDLSAMEWSSWSEDGVNYLGISGGYLLVMVQENLEWAMYQIKELTESRLVVETVSWDGTWTLVFVSENFVEDPVESGVAAALSGKTFGVSRFGWWGTGWEYFDDPVPESTAEDRIAFNTDGTLTIDLGENLTIYNDGGVRMWSVTGTETWTVQSDDTGEYVKFDNGGFPLMLAGQGDVTADDPTYNWGLNGQWTVTSIEEGTVRLDIYQEWTGDQWFTVFLTPVE